MNAEWMGVKIIMSKVSFNPVNAIKRLVPKTIKQSIRNTINDRVLSQAVKEIAQLPMGRLPSAELLEKLQKGWDNEGMAAQTGYLMEVSRQALNVKDAVLECGSGLTTLLLGLLAGRRGVQIWTFEHHAEWHARVSEMLARHKISGVNNCLVPLRIYGEFSWYEPPFEQLPMKFSLVVCDGPPGDTPGGRYGLLPTMKERITSGTIILLDDADRPDEAKAIQDWQELRPLSVAFHPQNRGQFAIITVGEHPV